MTRWILAAIVLALASGCTDQTFNDQKIEAEKRWFNTRAQVLYRLASNRLKGGQLDAADKAVQEALVLSADYTPAQMLLVKIHIEKGRYGEAIALIGTIIDGAGETSETAYLLGVAQEKSRKLPEALASYRRSYSLNESNIPAVKAAAEVLVAMGEIRRAQLYIDSYLSKAGEDPGMYELAGRLAMMAKEYDRAAELYQRAADIDYENIRYTEAVARAQYSAGRFEQASESLTQLLDKPEYKAGVWVHMMLGDSKLACGKSHQAFDAYFTASEMVPDEPEVWSSLARSALAMNDLSRAVLAARQALRLDGGLADAMVVLGYALLRQGQTDQALTTLAAAAAAHPRNSMLQCLLGRAYAADGKDQQAAACYRLAVQIDPKNSVARELLSLAGSPRLSKVD